MEEKISAEETAAEAEAKLIEIRLEIGFRQTMISAQDDMEPAEQTRIRIIAAIFADKVRQRGDVAGIAIAADSIA